MKTSEVAPPVKRENPPPSSPPIRGTLPGVTIDAHIDTPWQMHKHGPFSMRARGPGDVDFDRMKKGGLDRATFALYLSEAMQDAYGPNRSWRAIQNQQAWVKEQMKGEPFYLAMEGGRLLNEDPIRFYEAADMGIKYLTLVHSRNTAWADSCTDTPNGGLRGFGRKLVDMAEERGVLIDVSHLSDGTFWDVVKYASKPIIASHSGCRALIDHPRNLTDEQIEYVASTGGVIHVPFATKFVGDSDGIADHIMRMVRLVGAKHVGIGSDLDGAECEVDAASWKDVTVDSLRLYGIREEQINLICGGNTLRLFEGV